MTNNVYKQRRADDAGRVYGTSCFYWEFYYSYYLFHGIEIEMAEPSRNEETVISNPPNSEKELACQKPTEEGSSPDITVIPTPEPLQIKVNSEHHVYLIVNEKEIHGTENNLTIDSESVSEEEGEKENENEENAASSDKAYSSKAFDDDLTNKVKLIINVEGFKEAGGE